MKVFISADMEGISGIATGAMTSSGDKDYGRARELMTGDVNAAIEGALEAGATEIWVKDAHASATNLLVEKILPPARVLQGWCGVPRMVEGINESFDALLLVGYHARAMTEAGTISHTMTGQTRGLWYNGVEIGESGISAAHAGCYGVPLVFVSGDEALAAEVHTVIHPAIEAATVKSALGRECGWLLPLEEAHAAIRAGVAQGLSRRSAIAPFQPESPIEVKLQFHRAEQALAASMVPTVRRLDSLTVAAEAADGVQAANLVAVLLNVAR